MIHASPASVWELVSDPYHLPRWWPRTVRVEGVHERARGAGTRWTKVLRAASGRDLRADFTCLYSHQGTAYAWEQDLEDSPFSRLLRSSATKIDLSAADAAEPEATRVRIVVEQRLRGLNRLGGLLARRAAGRQLDEALDGLARALEHEDEQP